MIAYIEKNRDWLKRFVKWSCFALLLITASMTVVALGMEGLQNGKIVTQRIYDYNCTFCVISILLHIFYLIVIFAGKRKDEIVASIKGFFKKEWPCLLLIIFMVWTAVGCIGAGIEAKAEANLKEVYEDYKAGKIENIVELEKIAGTDLKIAKWSSGDRAENDGALEL